MHDFLLYRIYRAKDVNGRALRLLSEIEVLQILNVSVSIPAKCFASCVGHVRVKRNAKY